MSMGKPMVMVRRSCAVKFDYPVAKARLLLQLQRNQLSKPEDITDATSNVNDLNTASHYYLSSSTHACRIRRVIRMLQRLSLHVLF